MKQVKNLFFYTVREKNFWFYHFFIFKMSFLGGSLPDNVVIDRSISTVAYAPNKISLTKNIALPGQIFAQKL